MNNLNTQIIKHKAGLLNLAEELGNISKACKMMGYSRDTFYRYKDAVNDGGIEALLNKNRKKPNLKNRTDEVIEAAIVAMAIDQPAWGQKRVSNELRKKDIHISDGGVRSVWKRNNLESMKKRLKALEAKMAREKGIYTEEQLVLLERQKEKELFEGEIETEHPGYLGSQDTFYVGVLKGVGRIYQQTFVDTYSKVAQCKLYNGKNALTAADLLNDRVLPLFQQYDVEILRMLTDRGTEYCGKSDEHEYQLYLAINDIEHSRTKVRSPQQNGICERFHKTILDEFYQRAFRRKIYDSISELQIDLDKWLEYYNNERTHQGKLCCGRTPMETFRDGIKKAHEKQLNKLRFPLENLSHRSSRSEDLVKGGSFFEEKVAMTTLDNDRKSELQEGGQLR